MYEENAPGYGCRHAPSHKDLLYFNNLTRTLEERLKGQREQGASPACVQQVRKTQNIMERRGTPSTVKQCFFLFI